MLEITISSTTFKEWDTQQVLIGAALNILPYCVDKTTKCLLECFPLSSGIPLDQIIQILGPIRMDGVSRDADSKCAVCD